MIIIKFKDIQIYNLYFGINRKKGFIFKDSVKMKYFSKQYYLVPSEEIPFSNTMFLENFM